MSASNKAGHWQYALQLFDQLASDVGSSEQRRNSDIIPDVVLFNAAITACASGAAWERAWAIFSGAALPVPPSPISTHEHICTSGQQPVVDKIAQYTSIHTIKERHDP